MTSLCLCGTVVRLLLSILELTVFIDFTMVESSTRNLQELRKHEIEFIGRKIL